MFPHSPRYGPSLRCALHLVRLDRIITLLRGHETDVLRVLGAVRMVEIDDIGWKVAQRWRSSRALGRGGRRGSSRRRRAAGACGRGSRAWASPWAQQQASLEEVECEGGACRDEGEDEEDGVVGLEHVDGTLHDRPMRCGSDVLVMGNRGCPEDGFQEDRVTGGCKKVVTARLRGRNQTGSQYHEFPS